MDWNFLIPFLAGGAIGAVIRLAYDLMTAGCW